MHETLMACLTPVGKAAIATLGVRGSQAWDVVRPLFQLSIPGTPARQLPESPEPDRFWFGRLGNAGPGGSDEVVLSVRRGSPCPWLEIHCHGGQQVVALLMETLGARGAVACSWQELEWRTTADPLQCLAREALTQAPTVRTAQILLDQVHGAFAESLAGIVAHLQQGDAAAATSELRVLAGRASLGRRLVQPWKVVVAGPPNVGKSSLVNALAGYNRCLVSAQPGTTRDVVSITLAIDGWPVELLDTAGCRNADQHIEREGIERGRHAASHADLCLWLLDGSVPFTPPPALSARQRDVITKTDLAPAWNWDDQPQGQRVSALTRSGLDELCQIISRELVPLPPPAGAAVPFIPHLCERIAEASQFASQGRPQETVQVLQTIMARS